MTKIEKLYIAQEAAKIIVKANRQIDELQELINKNWEIKKMTMAEVKNLGIEYEVMQQIIYMEKN